MKIAILMNSNKERFPMMYISTYSDVDTAKSRVAMALARDGAEYVSDWQTITLWDRVAFKCHSRIKTGRKIMKEWWFIIVDEVKSYDR